MEIGEGGDGDAENKEENQAIIRKKKLGTTLHRTMSLCYLDWKNIDGKYRNPNDNTEIIWLDI